MSDSELIFFGVPFGVMLSALLFWLAVPLYQWGTGGHLYFHTWHFMVMVCSFAFVVAWFLVALLVAGLRMLVARRRRSA